MEAIDIFPYIKLVQKKIGAYNDYMNDLFEQHNKGFKDKLLENRNLFKADGEPNLETYESELKKIVQDVQLNAPPFDREKVMSMLSITEEDLDKLIIRADDNKRT